MSRNVKCPHCLESLEIPDELLNNEVRCALCQSTFVAQESGRPDPVPQVSRREYDPYEERLRDELQPRRRSSRQGQGGSRAWVWILVIGMFGCCGVSCAGFGVYVIFVAFPDFVPYTSSEGDYQAVFPGTPTASTQKNKLAVDDNENVTQLSRQMAADRYAIRTLKLPAKTDDDKANAILKDAADQLVSAMPGSKEMSRIDTTSQTYPAIEIEILHPDSVTTLGKLIVANDKLYIVTMSAPSANLEDPRAIKYFGGFEILHQAK